MGIVEVLVVLFVAFLVIGPRKMIEWGKQLGKRIHELGRTLND